MRLSEMLSFPFVLALPLALNAQSEAMTLSQAVTRALDKYPAMEVSQAQIQAAAAGICLARTSYLPKVDLLAQANRATRNNVIGLTFPQGLPGISGSTTDHYNGTAIWGSMAGVLVAWEPFDFGARSANVEAAVQANKRAEAAAERTKLQVATLTADSFLTLLAAEQTVKAAEANVERSSTFLRVVESLVKSELRPGVELSRAKAEESVAKTQLIQARQAVANAKALLGSILSLEPSEIKIAPGPLLGLPASSEKTDGKLDQAIAKNPAILEQHQAIQEASARLKSASSSYYPRFNLLGSWYGRGTGMNTDGTLKSSSDGLKPNMRNWALGVTMSFQVMDFAAFKARRAVERSRTEGEKSRYRQVVEDLKGRMHTSISALDAAREIAANTPVQLEAAQATHQQATARYKAGLSNVIDVSDAQRLLAQSEINDSLAKLGVWRAQLSIGSTQGDLQPFLQSINK